MRKEEISEQEQVPAEDKGKDNTAPETGDWARQLANG